MKLRSFVKADHHQLIYDTTPVYQGRVSEFVYSYILPYPYHFNLYFTRPWITQELLLALYFLHKLQEVLSKQFRFLKGCKVPPSGHVGVRADISELCAGPDPGTMAQLVGKRR